MLFSLVVCLLAAPSSARAGDALEPTFNAALAGSYWPLGLKIALRPGAKLTLPWQNEESVLFSDPNLQMDLIMDMTPAYGRFGPEITFSPLAILDLSAQYVSGPYLGTFSSLLSFSDADTVYDTDTIDAAIDDQGQSAGLVSRYGGDATLKAQAGPIIIALSGAWRSWNVTPSEEKEGDYFYEPEMDLMLAFQDTTIEGTGALLYDLKFSDPEQTWMYIGLRYYTAAASSTGSSHTKIGPLVVLNTKGGKWSYLALAHANIGHVVFTTPMPPYVAVKVKYSMKDFSWMRSGS